MPTVIDELVTILGLDIASGVAAKVQKFNAGLDGVTRFAGWAGAALTAAAGSIAYFVERASQAAAEIDKFRQLTGISTTVLQGFQFAVEQVGGSADVLTGDLMSLTKGMSSPIPGEFNHALFMLGINLRKAGGEAKTADEVLLDIADRLKGMSTIQQIQWASRIGLSNDTILLLQEGRGEIERLIQQAKDIPTIVGPQQLKDAREFVIQLQMVRRIFTYLGQEVSSAAGPAMRAIVGNFSDWLKLNNEFIQSGLRNFIDGVVEGFSRFGHIISTVRNEVEHYLPQAGKFIEVLTGTQTISAVVFATLSALVGVLVLMGIKFAAVAASILAAALVFEDFLTYLRGGNSAIGELIKWVDKMYDQFSKKFPAITDVLKSFAAVIKGVVVISIDAVTKSVKLLWEGLKMMGGALSWILDKVEGGLSFLGFGSGSNMSPLTQDVMNEIASKVSAFGTGLVQDAQRFNTTQAPLPVQSGRGPGLSDWQQKVEVNQVFNIQGDNAVGVASETSRKMETALHQLFPGGLAPVSN